MQCLTIWLYYYRHGQFFPALSVQSDLNSIHLFLSLHLENKRKHEHKLQMITASHAYLVTRSKNIKNGMFSVATPYFSKKGQWKWLSLYGCHLPIRKVSGYHAKKRQWSVRFILKWNFLVFSGAVKDGSDTKSIQENTEVTLLKHASASNKHVCEVRSSAPRSQHMFIAPEK